MGCNKLPARIMYHPTAAGPPPTIPLPELPPVAVPAPLQPRKAHSKVDRERLANTTSKSLTSSETGARGEPRLRPVQEALPSARMPEMQRGAMAFRDRPLPPTPGYFRPAQKVKPQLRHQHKRTASSDRLMPSPSHSRNLSAPSIGSPLSPNLDQSIHRRQASTSAAVVSPAGRSGFSSVASSYHNRSTQKAQTRLRRRSGRSRRTMVSKGSDQSVWTRTAYISGPIKLRKRGLQEASAPPSESGSLVANDDFATQTLDLFSQILDDRSPETVKKTEDALIGDLVDFIQSMGIEPESFAGDQYWIEPQPRYARIGRPGVASHYRGESISVPNTAYLQSPGSLHSISTATPSPHRRRDSHQGSRSPDANRISWTMLPKGNHSPTSPRHLPPSPTVQLMSPKSVFLAEKERKAALKRASAGSPSKEGKIGLRRLLKGAGSIV